MARVYMAVSSLNEVVIVCTCMAELHTPVDYMPLYTYAY